MARFFLDHNVSIHLQHALRDIGHLALAVRNRFDPRATDEFVLLYAAEQDLILVTHNRRDFELLHFAWTRWSIAWAVQPSHSGILILPQDWSIAHTAHELTSVADDLDLRNKLFLHNHERGWYVKSFSGHVIVDEM